MTHLRVAACAFESSGDATKNLQVILSALAKASVMEARVLVVPECALCGYPPVTGGSPEQMICARPGANFHQNDPSSLCALGDHEDLLHIRAQAYGIALIVGNASFWQDGMSNDLFVCGDVEQMVRYRKRFLTPSDEAFFQPGHEPVCCQVDDWKIGLSICFDLRFSQHWNELAQQNCDLFINAAYMAGPDHDEVKKEVIPSLYQARATEWVTPLLLCNTSAEDKWLPSRAWSGTGKLLQECHEGMFVQEFTKREQLPSWYHDLHRKAIS